jgi:hypothetical protein
LNIVNFAYVRSAIALTIAVISLWGAGLAQAAPPHVTLVLLPKTTGVAELMRDGMAVGLLSAGLGSVPAEQTYLDVSQGNRVFDSLYDTELPREVKGGMCGPAYSPAVVERAKSAPADIVPGLLAETLHEAGERCAVRSVELRQLRTLIHGLHGNDLLIAIERAPPEENGALAIGIAGRGFHGELTSDSTRTKGYVLSTDIAPTILRRLGLPVPSEMSGQPIRAEGSVGVGSLESLASRMASISERRGPVIGASLAVWLVALALAVLLSRGRLARTAVKLTGLSVVYLPLVLLFCATLESSQGAEQLIVLVGAPICAALTLAVARGYRALAVASVLVVLAYAIDVAVGSPLTALSLLGPNPGLGVRFYGIGNELEALLSVLVVGGSGAALQAFAPRLPAKTAAVAFIAAGLGFAFVFAAGSFGADVGAAIAIPIGAAAAASKVATPQRHAALSIIAISLAFVGLVSLIDLISGANAHLTRSVLDAGGLDELAQVAERRLRLSAHSFSRPVVLLFLPLLVAVGALALRHRQSLRHWLHGVPAVEAGLFGALIAIVVGTLANDSGALVLEIGCAYLLTFAGYAWAEAPPRHASATVER